MVRESFENLIALDRFARQSLAVAERNRARASAEVSSAKSVGSKSRAGIRLKEAERAFKSAQAEVERTDGAVTRALSNHDAAIAKPVIQSAKRSEAERGPQEATETPQIRHDRAVAAAELRAYIQAARDEAGAPPDWKDTGKE